MTAQQPAGDGDAGWSSLHSGVQPSRLVRGWLSMVRMLARGPIVRIPPDVLSLLGVLALVGAWAAVAGPGWPALTVALVLAAGVLDGLDGAVALRTGKARPLGAVLLALCAAPGWVIAALTLVLLLEYVRARAQAVGMPGAGAITVGERPTRLIVVGLAAAGAAISGAGVPLTGWDWGTMFALTWTAVGVVAMVQLWLGIRRSIPATYPPDR